MIFVTVGTTSFPFDRLLGAVDEAMNLRVWGISKACALRANGFRVQGEELIVQKGVSLYQFKYPNTKVFKELPFDRMIAYMKKARVIVTAGGPATIFLALKYGMKKPIVVPRSKKFEEHVDDHEVLFARFMEKKNLIKLIKPNDDMVKMITKYFLRPDGIFLRQLADQDDKQKLLVKKLIDYTDSLE